MSRELTGASAAELSAPVVRPVVFYEGEFAAGTVRLWSGSGAITWNGQTWVGRGDLMGVSQIAETADMRAEGITVSVSGMSPSVMSLVLAEARLGKPGRVWVGFVTEAGAIIVDPYMAFKGKLDVPTIELSGDSMTVSISYENHLIDLERARVWRWTHEIQQLLHPGSKGFQFASQQSDIKLIF